MNTIEATDNVGRRFGFVMEQTLGHVTHYKNLRTTVDGVANVDAAWYPLTFGPYSGLETLPGIRSNWSVRASLRARSILRSTGALPQFDALFFHTQVATLLSVNMMRRIPTVVSLDATPINYDTVGTAYGHRTEGGLVEGLKRTLNKRSLHAAHALVTWSAWARQSLIDDYDINPASITVIAPGVNLDLWSPPTHKEDTDVIRLLFVGADFERKGGVSLLHAFETLRDRCELHIVTKAYLDLGPGIYVYHDVAPNSDLLRDLYAKADIFVLPTLADCYSIASIEAMASGLPVITCPIGGISEIVLHGETGLLVSPDNVSTLHAAIAALANDRTKRHGMGVRGRLHVEQHFDSATNAHRILNIMMTAADGS